SEMCIRDSSLTGISLLIAEHPWLFMAVKVVGALYLGWLGWGALKAAWHSSATLAPKAGGAPVSFTHLNLPTT
ncbi:LysE family transporter, partial [Aeromonas salmonicida]|uniref:LysE family transporter n=1 Tax=Aeromonas salmonicida TaxID=645 RepID=UPI003D31B3EC